MVRLDAGGRIDDEGVDAFGRVMRDGFDVHAAFGRGDQCDAARPTVDEQREVEFSMSAVSDIGRRLTCLPCSPVWIVTSVLPSMSLAWARTSSSEKARRTPPLASAAVP